MVEEHNVTVSQSSYYVPFPSPPPPLPLTLQEVVGAVVTHVGSGFPSEVDAAFDVLLSLVKADVDGMRRFDVFIKAWHSQHKHPTSVTAVL